MREMLWIATENIMIRRLYTVMSKSVITKGGNQLGFSNHTVLNSEVVLYDIFPGKHSCSPSPESIPAVLSKNIITLHAARTKELKFENKT